MSLHGEIKVNGHEIGRWNARRKEHPPQEVNTYEVVVLYSEPGDVPGLDGRSHTVRGEIQHNFGDGAVTLAAKVLAWAAPLLPPRAPYTG